MLMFVFQGFNSSGRSRTWFLQIPGNQNNNSQAEQEDLVMQEQDEYRGEPEQRNCLLGWGCACSEDSVQIIIESYHSPLYSDTILIS